ncbi:MAG: glycosyltransferase [Phycisphaerales bacterium]
MTALSAIPAPPPPPAPRGPLLPLTVRGKFLFAGEEKFYVRGVTYGPFRPNEDGEYGPRGRIREDFALAAGHGINAVRVYTVPPLWFMDEAAEAGLRVMVGVPWAQHLPFLETRRHLQEARAGVANAARLLGEHPALLALSVGNEIPAGVVRWYGHGRIERTIRQLCDEARQAAPRALLTYVNYPPTEYLRLPFLDVLSFNVFLERPDQFRRYLARLQSIAQERPLVMTELGLDSLRNGEERQAESVSWQVREALEAGAAGAIVFSWTDEWHRGGSDIDDWAFGLTDRQRRPKPALAALRDTFAEVPCERARLPRASVVVCTYNGVRTLRRTLRALADLDYPDCEVIVVDDGSKDGAADIAAEFPVRLIRTENRGLSSARNTGLAAATGEIVAYTDDDAFPDPQWLQYLARTLRDGHAGAGGPNLPVPGDGWVAQCITNTAGNPTHVLLSDTIAEHVPGCSMAFWKWALEGVGGFDTQFRIAGDDVDLCWRMQALGWTLGFSPGAMVWHHRRQTVRAFWKQQLNYGRAEADLERKWPEKYNAAGHATWTGRLYGHGTPPLLIPERRRIYHGVWGVALFQHVYPTRHSSLWAMPMMPEWYAIAAAAAVLSLAGLLWPPMLLFAPLPVAMLLFAGAQAAVHAARVRFSEPPASHAAALRMRLLVAMLYILQPVARLSGRLRKGLTPIRRRGVRGLASPLSCRIEAWCKHWRDPSARLAELEGALKGCGAVVMRGHEFARWDLELRGGLFGRVRIAQFTADLAHSAQYVQLRAVPRCAPLGVLLFAVGCAVCLGAVQRGAFLLAGSSWIVAAAIALIAARELAAAMATFRQVSAGALREEP